MIDLDEFYKMVNKGEHIDRNELLAYFKKFEQVVIWGAGNLGSALGRILSTEGVSVSKYWDKNYVSIKSVEGVEVVDTFLGVNSPQKTLVVIGIVNGTQSHKWQIDQLKNKGFDNYILGQHLYEEIGCPMKLGEKLRPELCTKTSVCNINTCKKYRRILEENCNANKEDSIVVSVLDVIVSHRCSLDCYNCGQRQGVITREHPEYCIDYSADRICKDIDYVSENIDAIGTFSIIGGEAFLNKDLAKIVKHATTKANVGIVSVTSNGICNIKDDMLEVLKHPKVKFNFSNYTESLTKDKSELFWNNVKRVRDAGVYCNISTPLWMGPIDGKWELKEKPDFSPERLETVRRACVEGPAICNGFFYACPVAETYSKVETFPIEGYYFELDKSDNVRKDIYNILSKRYYSVCGGPHCGNGHLSEQVKPGVQYIDVN